MNAVVKWLVNITIADWIARLGMWIGDKQMDEIRELFSRQPIFSRSEVAG